MSRAQETQKLVDNSNNDVDDHSDSAANVVIYDRSNSSHEYVQSGYEISNDSMDEDHCNGDLEYSDDISYASSTQLITSKQTPLVRCCHAFWNLFKVMAVCMSLFWISFLLILCIQPSMSNIHRIIADIDPIASPNHPIMHHRVRSASSTCSLTDFNALIQEFNVYLLLHFIRWFLCALIYRNRVILWINSVVWELLQFCVSSVTILNLQWIGQGCWYSMILDIFLCNLLGIELGQLLVTQCKVCRSYDDAFNAIFMGKEGCCASMLVVWCTVVLFQLQQLLMFIVFDQSFGDHTNGWLIWYRCFIYFLCSLFCVNQLYHWLQRRQSSIGSKGRKHCSMGFVVIMNCLVLSELFIAIKTYTSPS